MEPEVFGAAGHPLRWRLLTALAETDLRVQELTARVEQPQNLVSYHLGRLRKASLVEARRSIADRRDTYYRLDLARCGRLLADAGGSLHPGLRWVPPPPPLSQGVRVLFLCTGNSSRSQMAEALARRAGIEAYSAGSRPKPIHPRAVAVMAARGLDLRGARSKHLDEFARQSFDRVITVCDKVREICPDYPGARHWSIPDPAQEPSLFDAVADELDERIGFLLHTVRS
ncbi:ArsR family transcriptional regulator [Paractinoplanes abujensis]|uniref:Protein-tyrosine-phosphatase/DNA-binding transcriptional ArsR family regulator n=1 Tax=Paractinoplanes abujensis TaxID=882441 RepID=A0A7W7CXF1_9ACTN|nr:ArsR family transcriptional regulator [Actinoplanes abujensis]MBB4696259.1 protein-tyrosine-phosphatase/DNA-binding transcriptional ArsR family regulator [Actinoplanes abujensis]GID22252.1 ArsR family transcriptional regulator [Actinoplanes abujensis]